MRHGKDMNFSCRGIQIAVQYWVKNGHKVICFLPEYLFNYDEINQKKKQLKLDLNANKKSLKTSKLPDSVGVLNQMANAGIMVKTPAQDYDDSYCIQYARQADAFIVTNDKFRDYLKKIELKVSSNLPDQLKAENAWIKQHSISFAFKEDEFLPNPDSKLFEKYSYQKYKSYPLEDEVGDIEMK